MDRKAINRDAAEKNLRDNLEALGDLRSHIENLRKICQAQEETLFQEALLKTELEPTRIDDIVALYRASNTVRDDQVSYWPRLREKTLFAFHIARLRLACMLNRIDAVPRLSCTLALQSLRGLNALAPGLLDVL